MTDGVDRDKIPLGDARKNYDYSSMTASTVNRALGFAAIGLIFTFREQSASGRVPDALVPVAVIASLLLDLLHYVVASAVWGRFCRAQEQKFGVSADTLVLVPSEINRPSIGLYCAKLAAMAFAYALLLKYLWANL